MDDGRVLQALPSVQPRWKPRWYHLYFLLAAFDVATVCISLYVNHYSNSVFLRAIDTNTVWLAQLSNYSELGDLAGAVNAPGNDIFDSRDVATERKRLDRALLNFNAAFLQHREALANLVRLGYLGFDGHERIERDFQVIDQRAQEMVSSARSIFRYFEAGDASAAAALMASMDRTYAALSSSIGLLRAHAREVLAQELAAQQQLVADLKWLERVVMLLALLMIVCVTVYGHRLAVQMKLAEEEREIRLRELSAAKEELERGEARLKTLTGQAPVGIFETDSNGLCVYVNNEWCRIAGMDIEQARASGWSNAVHPDDRDLVFKEWYAAAHRKEPFALNYRFRTPDGVVTWVRGQAAAIHLSDGVVAGYVGSLTDISRFKEIEDNLRESKRLADEATESKSQFLANMSHEIRTPMNGVLGMLDLVLETELDPDQRDLAETAKLSASSLLGIINDILDFSKIEAGKVSISPYPFSITDFTREIERVFVPMFAKQRVELVVALEVNGGDRVLGDADRIRQVVTNLLSNALKFTPANGGVVFGVRIDEAVGDVRPIFVRVSDSGIGIPAERQAKIFEAFTQADGTTTRHFGGTGLGLTISAKLVELMGGKLHIASRPGVGSVFYFQLDLPVNGKVQSLEGQDLKTEEQERFQPLSVLLVEDNAVNQKLARRILEKAGHQVVVASNGQEACERVETGDFDIVLMDIQMPVMGGDAATRLIRERELARHTRAVPIIALTANAMEGDRERYLAMGMQGYLTKPFDRRRLLAVIAENATPLT